MRQNLCPGCKKRTYFKKTDGVCGLCLKAIERYSEMLKQTKSIDQSQKVVLRLPNSDYNWPGFYNSIPNSVQHGGYRDKLRSAIAMAYRVIGTPCPPLYTSIEINPWRYGKWAACTDAARVIMPLKQYRCLKLIRLLIEKVLIETYEGAVLEGKDLLLSLADGSISPDDISERDVERAQNTQRIIKNIDADLEDTDEP